jgi:iron complex outermembrane recepter protein
VGKNRILNHAVRAVLAAAAASAVVPVAHAQTAPAPVPSDTQEGLAEVVVTGSRIQSENLISISPVTSVTATEIEQTGATRIEDVLNMLPQVFAGQGSGVSNASDGTATVDLHDLGPQRTLVLVNGRRLAPGAPDGRNYADLDQIPTELVDRVEVLTGGASSTYGADAVSGVVNFILNTHYEGVKLDVGYGLYQHDNHQGLYQSIENSAGDTIPPHEVNTGFNKNLAFTAGSNFADGKGNATIYATYTNQAAVLQSKFDYSACTLASGGNGNRPVCGGSATNQGGTFFVYNSSGVNQITNTVDQKTGVFRPETASDLYNYGPLNYYMRPSEKYTAGAFLNYDINEHVNAYAEVMYMRNSTTAQLAPDGDFEDNGPLATGAISLNCGAVGPGLPGNPLLTAQERSVLCNPTLLASQGQAPGGSLTYYLLRRNVEGGGRQFSFVNDDYRTVVGAKGDIVDGIKFDVYGQVGITDAFTSDTNFFNTAALGNALNVVQTATGPACAAAVAGTATKCVPYNIFVPGAITPAALAYLNIPLTSQGSVHEYIASGNVTADLGKYGVQLPTAKSGVQFNLGTEYREEQSNFLPDYAEQASLSSNGATLPLAGEFHVAEVFGEINAPILDGVPGADQLTLNAGYRFSDYNLGFNTNTYKFGVEWAPVKDVRFRGSYTQSVRAPNISELYSSPVVGPNGTTDPCWGPTPSLTQAQCIRTGLAANLYGKLAANPANQFNTSVGGNPALSPEIAHTWSYGVVFQPSFVPNLSLTVDYYDIRITGAIEQQSGTAVILGCALGNNADCTLIHRGTNGSLWANDTDYVSTLDANTGLLQDKGIDITAHYVWNLDQFGKLVFNLQGTDTLSNITQPAQSVATPTGTTVGPSYNCAGYFGNTCTNPLPHWRHVFSTDWATPWSGLDFNVRWRFIGPTDVDALNQSSLLSDPGSVYQGYSRIPSFSYIDASASVAVASNVEIRLGVNNLLDKDPPIVLSGNCPAGSCNGNTFSQTYDVLGRYLYAKASIKF